MKQLEIRCRLVERLFKKLLKTNSRYEKEVMVEAFRQEHPKMNKDLDFCFEVLAGKHKLGYTADFFCNDNWDINGEGDLTIKKFYELLKTTDFSQDAINEKNAMCCAEIADFMQNLVNRVYRLGYSNRRAMITNLSPMLAKKYPDDHREGWYYVQEKLDGNRCIAYFEPESGEWQFQARSGKPMKTNFDMSWADESLVYDGEVMTLKKAGTRDFNATSGAINGRYTDKSGLHYFVYDIVDASSTYEERKQILDEYATKDIGKDCSIVPVLDKVFVNPNPDYNWQLDGYLDKIVADGGEGIMLRDPDALYKHGEPRTNALLKYKKKQTMDLRIIGFNHGKPNGKYEYAIGSFQCETDDHEIQVNVSGMPDCIHFSDPNDWIGKIIEVDYFDTSKSKRKTSSSLRFPRLKRVRDDKETTSKY